MIIIEKSMAEKEVLARPILHSHIRHNAFIRLIVIVLCCKEIKLLLLSSEFKCFFYEIINNYELVYNSLMFFNV